MKYHSKVAFLLCGLFFINIVGAHSGATGVVKLRMDAMGDMGDKSKAVAGMFKGKANYDPLVIKAAAEAFFKHAEMIPELFPDTKTSRTGSKTDALPKIWVEWDKFVEFSEKFAADSVDLLARIDSGADQLTLKKGFFKTTKSCSDCHKQFRKPKK